MTVENDFYAMARRLQDEGVLDNTYQAPTGFGWVDADEARAAIALYRENNSQKASGFAGVIGRIGGVLTRTWRR